MKIKVQDNSVTIKGRLRKEIAADEDEHGDIYASGEYGWIEFQREIRCHSCGRLMGVLYFDEMEHDPWLQALGNECEACYYGVYD